MWDQFNERFDFRPDYYERVRPAIIEPAPSIVFDLDVEWSEEFVAMVSAAFRHAFESLIPAGDHLYFLDWQHPAYRYEPHADNDSPLPALPVLPDGDYYIFVSQDFSFGTFGHPWQQSLLVFGEALLAALAQGPALPMDQLRRQT